MDLKKIKRILNNAIRRWNNDSAIKSNNYIFYSIKYYKLNSDEVEYLYSNFNKYTSKHQSNYDLEINFTINGEVA